MISFDYYLSFYLFIISCFMFSFYYKHLLLVIISLEFITISVIYNMYIILIHIESNMYIIMFMMVVLVCEGVLSLSLIVLMVRFYGNDYINSLSVIKW